MAIRNQELISLLVREIGMEEILTCLIKHVKDLEEIRAKSQTKLPDPSMKDLRTYLEKTLDDYKRRYDKYGDY